VYGSDNKEAIMIPISGSRPTSPKHRVLLVDDHPLVRLGLRRIMENEADLTVCAEAESAQHARRVVSECRPDVMISGIGAKHADGIALIHDIRIHFPRLPILVLSALDEDIYAQRLLSVGANGYIMKEVAYEQVLIALRRVLSGEIYVSEAVGNTMIQQHLAGKAPLMANPIDRLSNRELQVLQLVGDGLGTREIADFLVLSIKTIESHRQRIKRKLSLHTGIQLMQYAISASASFSGLKLRLPAV
jgi:DNA-binding NarL/FixJ family response regulator